MNNNIKELINKLRDPDNCNVLDYIDEAADLIEEQSYIIDDLMFENESINRRINKLFIELNEYKDLAQRRLKRKNMYKERSENDLLEKERYRLDLEQVKKERDALVNRLHGKCEYCLHDAKPFDERMNICIECVFDKYRITWHNNKTYSDRWEWRGIVKDKECK